MEKKRNSCPIDACEKFFKAITVSSPFRPIRLISNHHHHHHHRDSNPSDPASNPIVKTHNLQTPKHPKFDFSASQKNGKVASVAPNKNMEPLSQLVQAKKIASKNNAVTAAQEKRHKATTRMESNNKMNASIEEDEDEFTKYINRARNKIRKTPSSLGDGKINKASSATGGGGGDTGEDHRFSDYINRAKKKMLRTMSGFVGGGGRGESI